MMENFIVLIEAYLTSGIMESVIFPIFGVAFVSFVPLLLKYLRHRS